MTSPISKGNPYIDRMINNPQLPKDGKGTPGKMIFPVGAKTYPREWRELDQKRYKARMIGAPTAGAVTGVAAENLLNRERDPEKNKEKGKKLMVGGAAAAAASPLKREVDMIFERKKYKARKGTTAGFKRSLCPTGAVITAGGAAVAGAGAAAYLRGKRDEKRVAKAFNVNDHLARLRTSPTGGDEARFEAILERMNIPASVKAKGPTGVQTYLAVRGIQISLPVIRRVLRNDVSKSFRPRLTLKRPSPLPSGAPALTKVTANKMPLRPRKIGP